MRRLDLAPNAPRGSRWENSCPPARPATLVVRSALDDRLTAGAGQRLTVVLASAGAGKSVLLSSWAAARPPGRDVLAVV